MEIDQLVHGTSFIELYETHPLNVPNSHLPYSLLGGTHCGGHNVAGRAIAPLCLEIKSSSGGINATEYLCVESVLSLANTVTRLRNVMRGLFEHLSKSDLKLL